MTPFQLHLENPDHVSFAPKILSILNSTLPANSPLTPSAAASAINALYPSHRPETSTEAETEYVQSGGSFLWWFWDLFHDLARQVPHDSVENERLALIVKELHDLPSETVDLEGWGVTQLWGDLPLMGATLREKWDGDMRIPPDGDENQRFLNLQTYAARIAGHGLAPFEMYAIWALTDALEGEMTKVRGAPDIINPDPTAVENLSSKTALAAAWVIHAGNMLYGRDEEIYGTHGGPLWKLDKQVGRRSKQKYKGTKGLCMERWKLWKERFEVIRDREEVDEDTRRVAGEAVDAMETVQEGSK